MTELPAQTGPTHDAHPRSGDSTTVSILVTTIGVALILLLLMQAGYGAMRYTASQERSVTTVDTTGLSGLEVDTSSGWVTIEYGPVREATLEVEWSGWEGPPAYRIERDGDVLRLSERVGAHWLLPWNDGSRATLTLPEELEGTIDAVVDFSSGTLALTGDFADVEIAVSSGSARFDGASSSISIDVSSGSATVLSQDVESLVVSVSSGRANATLRGTPPASTTVRVSSGSAHVILPEARYATTGTVSSGTRTLDVGADVDSPYLLEVNVSSGSATVGHD